MKNRFGVCEGKLKNVQMIFVNESGFYALVLGSKLPSAVMFKDWVTSVVLPQIRKTGGYIPVHEGESEEEMTELYGQDGIFVGELHQINQAVGMNQPIEKLLYEFALRSDCEDIQNFSDVFLFAKRSGGDFHKIIATTIEHISDKIEVEREVQTVISAKKMEQKIMNVIPVFIILYLNLTSGEFLAPLYGNIFGISVMTGALGAYLAAIKISAKMTAIKV